MRNLSDLHLPMTRNSSNVHFNSATSVTEFEYSLEIYDELPHGFQVFFRLRYGC